EARLLELIETLPKEDFPILLQLLQQAKSGMMLRSEPSSGPIVWTAFWQRFGERDPATALKCALACQDLKYPDRAALEKHLFTGMARNDPKAAAELLLAHPELPNQD